MLPDSRDAEPFRKALATASGKDVPAALMVGLCPRPMVEALLRQNADAALWEEEPGQQQTVLPVVVSTRDGFRFGFFGLDPAAE